MGVFREITIEWDGEDYVFTPSNRLLRRIEGQGVNIAVLMHGLAVGPISAPSLAFVAAEFLKAGGADVTEDDVFAYIMTATQGGIDALATSVAEAITPQEPEEKKPVARAVKSPSKKTATKRKP
jgi:hypothetical protein